MIKMDNGTMVKKHSTKHPMSPPKAVTQKLNKSTERENNTDITSPEQSWVTEESCEEVNEINVKYKESKKRKKKQDEVSCKDWPDESFQNQATDLSISSSFGLVMNSKCEESKKQKRKRDHSNSESWQEENFQGQTANDDGISGSSGLEMDGTCKESKKRKKKRDHSNSESWQDESFPSQTTDVVEISSSSGLEVDGTCKKSKKQKKKRDHSNSESWQDESFQGQTADDIGLSGSSGLEVDGTCKKSKKQKKKRDHSNSESWQDESFQGQTAYDIGLSGSSGLEMDGTCKESKKRKKKRDHSNSEKWQEESFQGQTADDDVGLSGSSGLEADGKYKESKKQKNKKDHSNNETWQDERFQSQKAYGVKISSNSQLEISSKKNQKTESTEAKEDNLLPDKSLKMPPELATLLETETEDLDLDELDNLLEMCEMKYEMSDELAERLSKLQIPLIFNVPESHKITFVISRDPTPEQHELLVQNGFDMKKGKFNPEEDNIIRKNWENFSKEFHFDDPAPFLMMSHNKKCYLPIKERRHFLQYIGRGLPNRYLNGIYRRFKMLYAPRSIIGRFTDRLDEIILAYKARGITDPFAKAGKIMGRDRHSVFKRYQLLQNYKKFKGMKRIKWSLEIAEMIVKSLMKVCEISDIEELYGKVISWSTWRFVGEECGYRGLALQQFWDTKLSTQIYATKPIFRKEILSQLVERMLELKIKYWQDVNWNELSMELHRASPLFLFQRLNRLKHHVPRETWPKLRAFLKYVKKHMADFRIPRAVLQRYNVDEDGNLLPIDDTASISSPAKDKIDKDGNLPPVNDTASNFMCSPAGI